MNTSTLSPWYVTGLLEAAGTLAYAGRGRRIAPVFALALPEAEAALLERIRRQLGGVGSVYKSPPRGGQHGRLVWRVTRGLDLVRLLEHFDRWPPQGRRAREYAVWRELVRIKLAAFRDPPGDILEELARRLSALRGARARRKGTTG